jgi:hypothetical protein
MGAEASMGVDTSRYPQQRLPDETPSHLVFLKTTFLSSHFTGLASRDALATRQTAQSVTCLSHAKPL